MKIKIYFLKGSRLSSVLYDYSEVFKLEKDVCVISDHVCSDERDDVKEVVRYNSDNCARIVFIE
jgi:hypothetical protein